jgi:hypothetical protein
VLFFRVRVGVVGVGLAGITLARHFGVWYALGSRTYIDVYSVYVYMNALCHIVVGTGIFE